MSLRMPWVPFVSADVISGGKQLAEAHIAEFGNREKGGHSISTVRHPSDFRFAIRFFVSR